MRLQFFVLVVAVLFAAALPSISKAAETDSSTVTNKFLRTRKLGKVSNSSSQDEERGAVEKARKALYKLKFPGWLARGKDEVWVAQKLKMTFPYVDDPMWSVYKSYKKAYDKLQQSIYPVGRSNGLLQ